MMLGVRLPRRWTLAVVVGLAAITAPATAEATLTFVRKPLHPVVWVAADNGKGAHRLASGGSPHVSPDGQQVAFRRSGNSKGTREELLVASAGGGAPRTLMVGWREPFYLAWSPDSTTIAALRGPSIGSLRLVLIDVASGAQRTVARGHFYGFSFAPEGGQLVYARSGSERYPPRSDVFRAAVSGGAPTRITKDHRSTNPLWGPDGKIVFVKQLGAKKRRYGPKNELYLMNPAGHSVRRLTHTKVGPLVQGLYPTALSANGRRLLAQFEGQDLTYAVTVNARTGAQRPLVEATEQGVVGTALSANGQFVLGSTGGFEPQPGHNVVRIPYGGGRQKILAKNAFEPDWSR